MNYKDSLEGPNFPPNPQDGDVASAIILMENRGTHCYGLSSCWEDMEAVMILPFFFVRAWCYQEQWRNP